MPRAAVNTEPSLPETYRQIAVLLSSALSFVAPERGEAMVRKSSQQLSREFADNISALFNDTNHS